MKSLWAPWRMEFISTVTNSTKSKARANECLFCSLQIQKKSVKSLVLHVGKNAYVLLNKYPYTNGHLLVLPKRHVADFTALTKTEHAELDQLLSRALQALKKALNPEGYNVGLNLGKAAGAGIESHLHYHIVPRWIGDANFMPVLGDHRVIPEFLHHTYHKLVKVF